MERETMEYSIDQSVTFEHWGSPLTGKIVGESGENFIVLLDHRLNNGTKDDGTKAMLVPAGFVRPIACYWCADTKKVEGVPVTSAQIESRDMPQITCPYCA